MFRAIDMLRSSLWWAALGPALLLSACSSTKPQPREFTVLCWNIHHGRGLDGRVDVRRIAAEIRKHDADFVCLQEVDRGVARSRRIDLPARLAELCAMRVAFGKNLDFQGGDYGNAILSRWPIVRSENHRYRMLRPNEQRGVLELVARVHGRRLRILNTHLGTGRDATERLLHSRRIVELACVDDLACVVAGDFNDYPDSPVHRVFADAGFVDAWSVAGIGSGGTYPSRKAVRRIDWVHSHGPIRAKLAAVGDSEASDHLPLKVVFRLAAH